MATAAPTQNLPLFYRGIEPLNVSQHGKMHVRSATNMGEVARTHAIPVTVDEFPLVQRHYPLVFSIRDGPIPSPLTGPAEGTHPFLAAATAGQARKDARANGRGVISAPR